MPNDETEKNPQMDPVGTAADAESPDYRPPSLETAPSSNDIAPERLASSPEVFHAADNHRFRKRYRTLNPEEALLADAIKDKANELAGLIDSIKDGTDRGQASRGVAREKAMAQTALEDCVMRAIRGVTA